MEKSFTCKELGGVCNEVFTGADFKAVGEMGGKHIMESEDEAHADMKKQMMESSEEDKQKWWDWFQQEWDKKA